jgi:hypothetical protein
MVGNSKMAGALGYCDDCKKLTYMSRKEARLVAKNHRPHKQAYKCPHYDQFWHIGDLPEPIKRGFVTREEFFGA